MSAFYLFALVFSVTSVGLTLSVLHALSSKRRLSGQLLLGGLSLWALLETLKHSQFEVDVSSASLLALLNSFLTGFCIRLTSNRINIPRSLKVVAVLSASTLLSVSIITPASPSQLLIIAFSGLTNTLCLMLFSERIYQIGKSKPGKPSALHRGLGLLALSLFAIFCEMAIAGRAHPLHTQIIAVSILILYPWLYHSATFLQTLPQHISISRPLVFHTTLFTLVGFYLIGLSGLGVIAAQANMDDTSVLLLVGAGVFPLMYLLSSQRWRRSLLVSINKHLFSSQFDYRATWRQLTQRLTPQLQGQQAVDVGLKTIQQLIHQPQGCYFRFDGTAFSWASGYNVDITEKEKSELSRFLTELVHDGWILDMKEYANHPERYKNIRPSLSRLLDHNIRWIVPVVINEATVAYWLIANSSAAKWSLNWETRDFLFALSQQCELYLQGQERQRELKEHAQLAAFHQTSAFVTHDIKNIYAQMRLINKNAQQHKTNPEFIDDMLESMQSIEARLGKTLSQLTNKQQHDSAQKITVSVSHLFEKLSSAIDTSKLTIEQEIPSNVMLHIDPESLLNIIKHLIDNAEYAIKKKNNGHIKIETEYNEKHATIAIKDNGVGMSEQFIAERLFKPFETTKGNSGMGLGMYEAKKFAEQSGGKLHVTSQLDAGTAIYLTLPRSGNA